MSVHTADASRWTKARWLFLLVAAVLSVTAPISGCNGTTTPEVVPPEDPPDPTLPAANHSDSVWGWAREYPSICPVQVEDYLLDSFDCYGYGYEQPIQSDRDWLNSTEVFNVVKAPVALNGCDDTAIYVHSAADSRFEFVGGPENEGTLRVFFVPDDQTRETYLLVYRHPEDEPSLLKSLKCYDGSTSAEHFKKEDAFLEGMKPVPLVEIPAADAGRYSVWVGTTPLEDDAKPEDIVAPGTLYVVGSQAVAPASMRLSLKADNGTATVNVDESYGELVPEPRTVAIGGDPLVGVVDVSYIVQRQFLDKEREEDVELLSRSFREDYETNSPEKSVFYDVSFPAKDEPLGYATVQPNVIVNWPGSAGGEEESLRFYFVSEDGYVDYPLIIHYVSADKGELTPQGGMTGWYYYLGDPFVDTPAGSMIEFGHVLPGSFRIWVAKSTDSPADEPIAGTLYISRLSLFDTGDPGGLNANRDLPDAPLTVPSGSNTAKVLHPLEVTAVAAEEAEETEEMIVRVPDEAAPEDEGEPKLNQGCKGMVAPYQPQTRVKWPKPEKGKSSFLAFHFVPDNPKSSSAALMVVDPDGQLRCDGATPNPMIPVQDAKAGDYTVWVGSKEALKSTSGTLYITGCATFDPVKPDVNPCNSGDTSSD